MPIDPELSDAELWQRASAGDGHAFGELFERHARAVYNHCFRRTADWSAAEDLTSVVFLEVWRRRKEVRLENASALPWLLGVANNVVRNRDRALRRHRGALGRLPRVPDEPDHSEDVAARLDSEQTMRRVLKLVARLPRTDQDVLALCAWDGLGYAEVAAVLGIRVGTVRSRLSRARERLRELQATEPDARHGHNEDEHRPVFRPMEEEA